MKAELMSYRADLLPAEHTHNTSCLCFSWEPARCGLWVCPWGRDFYAAVTSKSHGNLSHVSLPKEVCSLIRQMGLKDGKQKQRGFAVWGGNLSFSWVTCALA